MRESRRDSDYGGNVVASKVHETVTLTLPKQEAEKLYGVLADADDAYATYRVLGDVLGLD